MIIPRQSKSLKCYLLIGLPGSGKSTWCKKEHPDLPVVSRDIIRSNGFGYEFPRFCLGYTKSPKQKVVLSRDQEEKVTVSEYKLIRRLVKEKRDFIIDDTNIKKEYRLKLVEFLRELGVYIVMVFFNTPLNICIQRRKGQIDSLVMRNLGNALEKPSRDEYDKLIEV